MAGNTYLDVVNAVATQFRATQTSAGAGDAGKIPALDANGRLAAEMMPTGVGADTAVIQASEALSAGDFVNIHNVGGAWRIRKADGASAGKPVDGYVIAGVSSGATGTVYFEGRNTAVTGATPGRQYLSASVPGGFTATPPTGSGNVQQRVGISVSATEINFEAGEAYTLV
jgi:hypothetical protein